MEPLLDDEARRRLAGGGDGAGPAPAILQVATLAPGRFGVLDATVQSVSPPRPYRRKAGGEGLLQRVTLADATGEVDLVLWDAELRLVRDGPLRAGAWVRLRGATVRPGWRGGIELGLGSARVEPLPAVVVAQAQDEVLEGPLLSLAPAEAVMEDGATRFRAQVEVGGPQGPVRFIAWDALLLDLRRAGVGSRVRLAGLTPHPMLDGWKVAGLEARLDGSSAAGPP